MMDHASQILGLVAAVVIFWRVEPILNVMGLACPLLVRAAFWLLAVGSAGSVACILCRGYVPPPAFVALAVGVALLLVSERRVKALLRLHAQAPRERRATR